MAVHAFTSFSYAYLNRARVLASSLRDQHPDWVIWAVITDREPEGFEFRLEEEKFDHILTATELMGEGVEGWLFGHNVIEACTAVKARALQHIMTDPSAEKIIYLDPDIAVFGPLTPVTTLLDDYSIILTPHQIEPETSNQGVIDNEIASLQYGTYNLGFIALHNDEEAGRFATWWAERLQNWCHDRLDIGVFVDQKWCNLIPCFFESVKVLRDPGFNVASWNLSNRKVSITPNGEILVNSSPLRFFHFTKLGPIGDTMTRRYAGENTDVYELWWWYRQQVEKFTDPAIPAGWWYYNAFADGQAISQPMRELYRRREDLKAAFPDPWMSGSGSFAEWLKVNPHEMP